MTVTAYVSTGITVTFSTLTGELLDVRESGVKTDTVDVTKQNSTTGYREFKAGLKDGGEWTISFHYDPDAVIPAQGTSANLIITWPSGATNKYMATALLTGRSTAAPLGDKMMCDLTFKVTGVPDWDYT